MNEYVTFVQHNLLLVMGFLGILGYTVWVEYNRFTRKYKQLDTTQAVRLLNDENTVVVDVREANEVSAGKIKGARHIPLGQLATRVGELEKFKDQPILVYCRSGNRSAMAANTLTKKGFTNVNNLAGGVGAWETANLPLSKK